MEFLAFFQNNNIYFSTIKYVFSKENFTTQFFKRKLLICTQKNWRNFFLKLKVKGFQNTLNLHYDQRIWGGKDFASLDNAVLLSPQKCTFCSTSGHKTLSYQNKKKHSFKWTTPLELYNQDSLLSPVWVFQHILILALDFFQQSGHHTVPISCKAS